MTQLRNLAHLLGIGTDPALSRLLRACGVDEACVTGGASDYDKFLALATALPLCEGHPLRDGIHAKLTSAMGLSAPLCPHTAKAYWDAWVERYWYGGDTLPLPPLPASCPSCASCKPVVWLKDALTALPDPLLVRGENLIEWSFALEAFLPDEGGVAAVTLPETYGFVRPNPYHAGLAVSKSCGGEELADTDRNLLFTQALRVWGLALVSRDVTLLIRGGTSQTVLSLLAYLDASHALPRIVWIPAVPTDAGAVSGLYASVRTGMTLADSSPHRRDYAASAPIGTCVFLE